MAIWRGWRNTPTTRSVVAKQASAMLDLVWSDRLVFTATITRMLSAMMRGQVRAFTVILTVNTARTSCEIFEGFRGKEEKQQTDKLVLDVVSYMFVRFWLVKTSSLLDGSLPLRLVQSLIWWFVDNLKCFELRNFLWFGILITDECISCGQVNYLTYDWFVYVIWRGKNYYTVKVVPCEEEESIIIFLKWQGTH